MHLSILLYMSNEASKKTINKKPSSIGMIGLGLSVIILTILVYTLILIPPVVLYIYVSRFFALSSILRIIVFCFFLIFEFLFFIICQTIIPGIFLKALRLKVPEGEYNIAQKDKQLLKMVLLSLIYNPPLKLLEIFKLLYLRLFLHRCAGAKIGKNSLVPDTTNLYEPYLIEIGDNTIVGADCKISSHVIEHDKMIVKRVSIGNNCLIGAETLILPGAVVEDDVIIGIKSLVLKNQVLKKGKTYVGVPARELKR